MWVRAGTQVKCFRAAERFLILVLGCGRTVGVVSASASAQNTHHYPPVAETVGRLLSSTSNNQLLQFEANFTPPQKTRKDRKCRNKLPFQRQNSWTGLVTCMEPPKETNYFPNILSHQDWGGPRQQSDFIGTGGAFRKKKKFIFHFRAGGFLHAKSHRNR